MTAIDQESPSVLAHGRWAPNPATGGLTSLWQPAASTPPAHWHVPCEFCGAGVGQVCATATGTPTHTHGRRLEAYRQAVASDLSPTKEATR